MVFHVKDVKIVHDGDCAINEFASSANWMYMKDLNLQQLHHRRAREEKFFVKSACCNYSVFGSVRSWI